MSLDVLLVMPPYRLVPPFKYQMLDPPRSLGILATILREDGYSVEILDTSVHEMDYEEMAEEIGRRQPKLVGIHNRSTYSFPMVCKTANIIKDRWPDTVVLVGGTYVGHDPEGALRRSRSIDYIAIGESENHISQAVEMMLRGTDPNQVDGLAFKNKLGNPVRTKTFAPADLDHKILPAMDLLSLDKYVERNERYICELIRGCVHSCPYCTTSLTHGQGVRRRPVEHVIEELKLAKSYGFNYMYWVDDIFTVDRRLVIELCEAMVAEELNFLWPCMTTVGAVKPEVLQAMRRAGCDLVAYGVESFNEETLASVERLHSLRHIERAFQWTKEAGMRTLAFVIFGMPKSTFKDEMHTIRTLAGLQPDAVRAFSFKPYPGTIYYKEPKKMGLRILSDDYYRYSQLDEPTHETDDLTREEIIEAHTLCRYIYRSGGTVSPGKKLRRRQGVQVLKTGEGGLLYNPHNPDENRKTDSYLNALKLDHVYFEIMYRLDGYHNDDDIVQVLIKLFDMSQEAARDKLEEVQQKAIELDLVEEIPDIMAGKKTFHRGTEEEIFRSSRWARGESAFREDAPDEFEQPLRASASPV